MTPRVSWLDFKLGFRMLLKYPGLTIVAGFAIAFAIWAGAGTFEIVRQVMLPELRLPQGERLVGLQNWDASANRPERRLLHDLATWRHELRTVEDLGAFRTAQRMLIAPDVPVGAVRVAEMSAAGFTAARVAPALGRTLVEADEAPGATPVIVLGHEVWQERFGGDPGVVGRDVRLGGTPHTVVGVMPEGFAFPIYHQAWVPLRLDAAAYQPLEGPEILVFGRLAAGSSLEQAQAELSTLGKAAAAASRETHEHLRPRVLPFARSIVNLSLIETVALTSTNLPLLLFLALVCGNVALLMFARAAARENEIVVRNALGASRGRIIAQLFVEALVLAGAAAVVGLAAMDYGLRWALDVLESAILDGSPLPFWVRDSLSPTTLLYTALLTVAGAAIAGVLPALKVTRGLADGLRRASAGGGGFRFGGIWTAVVIVQVAVMVIFPIIAWTVQRDKRQYETADPGFPAENYLSVRLDVAREDERSGARVPLTPEERVGLLRTTAAELERRLEAEPRVAGVTFADRLPLMYHPHRKIEMDEGGAAPLPPQFPGPGHRVSSAHVALDYFDVLDVPILAGRGFHSGDLESEARVVVVNESFVERVLGGRNPIGRRLRYVLFEEDKRVRESGEEPWYRIVGVVPDLGTSVGDFDPKIAAFYHPADGVVAAPAHMAVHVRGDPASFAPRLGTVAAEVDPTLRLHDPMPLDEVVQVEIEFYRFWLWISVIVSGIAIVLSLAGIYAVLAFTVTQRTREIGIRVALGGAPRRIILSIFRRPLVQVTAGVLTGATVLAGMLVLGGGMLTPRQAALLVAYTVLMLGICLLACIVPTRRALSVEPTEALRADA